MFRFDEHRKESFRTSWRYHRQEFLVFFAAAAFYLLFTKDAKPSFATTIIYYIATVFPFFVIARILHSGFTGRFNKNSNLDSEGK